MSDEPCQTRTRLGLKSCLRITPPITPDLSAAPSPCTSGRTSPSLVSDSGSSVGSGGRKTVSFCSDDELEEIFWADEWDRTPAAVTPKLSYQDILELKQLRVNLPHAPPPPSSRQPFTTSAPSISKPPFPISRFANTASHTPSKWKNRSEPKRADVDPEILPYLDAVPIRLLPLLPQSVVESDPPSYCEPAPSAPSEPHPQTPTPTASPETRPTIQPPSEPPELQIEPVVPHPSISSSRTQTRRPNFSFVPLLPIQDPPVVSPPLIQTSAPMPPRRKFNMIFLPVNAVSEPDPSLNAKTLNQGTRAEGGVGVGTRMTAPLPSPASAFTGPDLGCADARQYTSVAGSEGMSLTPAMITSEVPSAMDPMLALSHPAALPSSITVESDTDTDNYTDTDAESDAPSTSTVASSLPSSPPCDLEDDVVLSDLKLTDGLVPSGYLPLIDRGSESGSYFPPVRLTTSESLAVCIPAHMHDTDLPSQFPHGPGQIPPLPALYPSPRSRTQPQLPSEALECGSESLALISTKSNTSVPPSFRPCLSLPTALSTAPSSDASLPNTPLSMNRSLRQKLMLEALPSPALLPPSPFELEPKQGGASPRIPAAAEGDIVEMATERLEVLRVSERTPIVRAAATAVLRTPGESPPQTLENLRASWDARARDRISGIAGPALAPSISRRRSLS